MKYFALIVTSLFLFNLNLSFAQTQPGYKLEFGVAGGTTTASPFGGVAGFDVRLEKDLSNRLSGTLTVGHTHLYDRIQYKSFNNYIYGGAYDVIPIKAGLKLFLNDKIYLGGEAGVGLGMERGTNSFLYAPSIGYAFKNGLDLSLKYEDYTRQTIGSNLTLRLAYGINLDKRFARKQTEHTDGWQLGFSIAPGNTNSNNLVLGGDVNLYRPLTRNLEATASVGVFRIFASDHYYDSSNQLRSSGQTLIPVMGGLRLFAGNKFYIAGETGAAFDTRGNAKFAWAPSAGLAFSNGLDMSLKYSGFSGNQVQDFIALKLGYHFKL